MEYYWLFVLSGTHKCFRFRLRTFILIFFSLICPVLLPSQSKITLMYDNLCKWNVRFCLGAQKKKKPSSTTQLYSCILGAKGGSILKQADSFIKLTVSTSLVLHNGPGDVLFPSHAATLHTPFRMCHMPFSQSTETSFWMNLFHSTFAHGLLEIANCPWKLSEKKQLSRVSHCFVCSWSKECEVNLINGYRKPQNYLALNFFLSGIIIIIVKGTLAVAFIWFQQREPLWVISIPVETAAAQQRRCWG